MVYLYWVESRQGPGRNGLNDTALKLSHYTSLGSGPEHLVPHWPGAVSGPWPPLGMNKPAVI